MPVLNVKSAEAGSKHEGHVLVWDLGGQRFHLLWINKQTTQARLALETKYAFQMMVEYPDQDKLHRHLVHLGCLGQLHEARWCGLHLQEGSVDLADQRLHT